MLGWWEEKEWRLGLSFGKWLIFVYYAEYQNINQ